MWLPLQHDIISMRRREVPRYRRLYVCRTKLVFCNNSNELFKPKTNVSLLRWWAELGWLDFEMLQPQKVSAVCVCVCLCRPLIDQPDVECSIQFYHILNKCKIVATTGIQFKFVIVRHVSGIVLYWIMPPILFTLHNSINCEGSSSNICQLLTRINFWFVETF